MKCPLFYANKMTDTGEWEESPRDCLKEECAWWDAELKQCAVFALNVGLATIHGTLEELLITMPTRNQFREQ